MGHSLFFSSGSTFWEINGSNISEKKIINGFKVINVSRKNTGSYFCMEMYAAMLIYRLKLCIYKILSRNDWDKQEISTMISTEIKPHITTIYKVIP